MTVNGKRQLEQLCLRVVATAAAPKGREMRINDAIATIMPGFCSVAFGHGLGGLYAVYELDLEGREKLIRCAKRNCGLDVINSSSTANSPPICQADKILMMLGYLSTTILSKIAMKLRVVANT